jgi:hypothetical protein
MRRAAATGPRRDRPPLLQQRALRTTLQRLLIGAAIVGASAVVSILLT